MCRPLEMVFSNGYDNGEIASIQTFAEGGIIQPIGEFMDQEDVADFYPGLMENCYVNGTLYGIPYLRSTPVLYYNLLLYTSRCV